MSRPKAANSLPNKEQLPGLEVRWDCILTKRDEGQSGPTRAEIAELRECWSLYPVLIHLAETQYGGKRQQVKKRHAEVSKALASAGKCTSGLDSLGAAIKAANKVVEKRLCLLNQRRAEVHEVLLGCLEPDESTLEGRREWDRRYQDAVMGAQRPVLESQCAKPILTWPDLPCFVVFDSKGSPRIIELAKDGVPPRDIQTINHAAELLEKLCQSWKDPVIDESEKDAEEAGSAEVAEGREGEPPQPGGESASGLIEDDPPDAERSIPMALAQMAKCLDDMEVRKFKTLAERSWGLKHVTKKAWTVRLDLMDIATRQKLEAGD